MEEDRKITSDDLRKATKEAVQHARDLLEKRALMSPEDRRANSRLRFSTMEEALELGVRGVFDYNMLDAIECAIRDGDILGNFVNGYIFGKILDNFRSHHYDPAALCILLIYEKHQDSLQITKKEIKGIIDGVLDAHSIGYDGGWYTDITMLSVAELEETKFLDKIFPHYIRIK
jgi:hypothetical protein